MSTQQGEQPVPTPAVQKVLSAKSAGSAAVLVAAATMFVNDRVVDAGFASLRSELAMQNAGTVARIDALETKMLAIASTQTNVLTRMEFIAWCERVADRLESKGITIPVPKE